MRSSVSIIAIGPSWPLKISGSFFPFVLKPALPAASAVAVVSGLRGMSYSNTCGFVLISAFSMRDWNISFPVA